MRIPLVVAIASAAVFSPTNAANLLQCVDPDVANAFLVFKNEPDRRITDELPVFYESIPVPDNFTFVGSSQSSRANSVAYRTTLPPVEAQELVEYSLVTSGWQLAAHRVSNESFGVSIQRGAATTRIILQRPR